MKAWLSQILKFSNLVMVLATKSDVLTPLNKIDSWLLETFKNCTFQIIGPLIEFNSRIIHYGSQHPIIIDIYEYPFHLGRYNRTKLRSTPQIEPTVISTFKPKFSPCIVQIFFLQSTAHPNLMMSSIENLINSLVLSNENPNFIIYMFNNIFNFNLRMLANGANTVSLTSVPLVVTANPEAVELLCLTCVHPSENLEGNLLESHMKSRIALETRVNVLGRNLRLRTVQMYTSTGFYSPGYPCSLYKGSLATHSSACTASTLAARYNFTYFGRVHPMLLLGSVATGVPMGKLAVQQTFVDTIKGSGVKNVWIPYGCIYKTYKYIAFLSKAHAVDSLSVFQPFDLLTAVLFLMSMAAVITVLLPLSIKCTKVFPNFTVTQILSTLISYTMKSVLEQGDVNVIMACRKTQGGYFLISTWLFLCYVLGNEYKGVMYSSMTSSPIQPVPESMVDLVMFSDMPYFTTTKHYYKGNPYSTMKDYVLADIIYTGEENFMTSFLHHFRNCLSLLYNSESDIIYNITHRLPVNSDHGPKLIRKKFAMVSTEEDSDLFVVLMQKLTDYYVIPNKKLSPFISRFPWHGKRNQFIQILTTGLSRLVQSGIYDNWNDQFHKFQLIQKLREVDKRENRTGTAYFSLVVMTTSSKLSTQQLDGSPVTWNSVDLVFLGCAILMGVAVVVLMLEYVFKKLLDVETSTPVVMYFEFAS